MSIPTIESLTQKYGTIDIQGSICLETGACCFSCIHDETEHNSGHFACCAVEDDVFSAYNMGLLSLAYMGNAWRFIIK